MDGDSLFKQAIAEMDDLSMDIIRQCEEFADEHDYSVEWVLDMFQERFGRNKRKYIKNSASR